MIEVKNLVKDYGGYLAVDHLSFTIPDGEIIGFLGPNGAGKSTTMNIMTGYLGATEGEVLINGKNILEEPDTARRLIGYLPEIPPLYPDMTVIEYLTFAAELKKIPKKDRESAISQAVKLTMLGDVKGRLIKNLSKGYRQRVGLAQAVLGMPPVIILDEPTVGLDPKQIIEIRDLIKSLGKKHTVILSSHILSEVSAVCDHILIISHGKLAANGTPESLENEMAGTQTVVLTVKGSGREAENALAGIQGIASIETEENGSHLTADLRLTLAPSQSPDEDSIRIREEVFFSLSEKKIPILAMQLEKTSLEQVFLELTQSAKEPSGEKEAENKRGKKQGRSFSLHRKPHHMKEKEPSSDGETEYAGEQEISGFSPSPAEHTSIPEEEDSNGSDL